MPSCEIVSKSIQNSYVWDSTCWHTFDTHLKSFKLINFHYYKQPTFICSSSFFAPDTPSGLQHFEFKHLFYWGVSSRTLLVENWQILCSHEQSLSRTTKAKLAHCYRPIVGGRKCLSRTLSCDSQQSWAHESKDSKSNLLVRAQAPSQKGAWSDCWCRPHQLVKGKLASPSKAEAAPLLRGHGDSQTFFFLFLSKIFSAIFGVIRFMWCA